MGDVVRFPTPPRSPQPHGQPGPGPAALWREAAGRTLRRERLAQERTLADVAGAAGISAQHLSEVERGLKDPSSEILDAVLGALGIRLLDLTDGVSRQLAARPHGPVCLAV